MTVGGERLLLVHVTVMLWLLSGTEKGTGFGRDLYVARTGCAPLPRFPLQQAQHALHQWRLHAPAVGDVPGCAQFEREPAELHQPFLGDWTRYRRPVKKSSAYPRFDKLAGGLETADVQPSTNGDVRGAQVVVDVALPLACNRRDECRNMQACITTHARQRIIGPDEQRVLVVEQPFSRRRRRVGTRPNRKVMAFVGEAFPEFSGRCNLDAHIGSIEQFEELPQDACRK